MATDPQQDFYTTYLPYATQAGADLGVSPQVILGQWALESGHGTSAASKQNNLGGIKPVPPTGLDYAAYKSPQDFADAYTNLIKARYPQALNTGSDVGAFTTALKGGGYYEAPQPAYAAGLQANMPKTAATAPQSDIDRFLTNPAAAATPAAPTSPPTAAAPPPSDVDRFLATPPPSTPAVAAVPAASPQAPSAAAGTPPPATSPPGPIAAPAAPAVTAAAPAPASQPALTVTGAWVPPVVTNAVAGINRGLTAVQSVGDTADAWLGRNVPGYQTAENALTRNTGGAVIPGAQASAQDQQRAAALDAQYGGGVAYWLGKIGAETVATAPIAGPIGRAVGYLGGKVVGPIADYFAGRTAAAGANLTDPAAVEAANVAAAGQRAAITGTGAAVGAGAGQGATFNALTGGVNEDPNSNPLTNAATGAVGGGLLGGVGNAIASGARALLGGVGPAVESMADRLGIPLSRGERLGGVAKQVEDASSGLPFSGAQKLADQKNAAYSQVLADKMGIPGPVQNVSTPMLNNAETRVSNGFQTVAPKLNAPMDTDFLNDITRIQGQAGLQGAGTAHANAAVNIGDQLFNTAAANNGVISGADLANFLKRGGDLDSLVSSGNPDVASVGRQMKDALMAAASRGTANPDDLAELQNLRQQWKAIQTARPVIDQTAAGSEEMSPQRLATAIRREYDMSYTGAGNEMQDLARVIQSTKALPSSGTAERLQRMQLLTGGLGLAGAGAGGGLLYAYDPNAASDAANAVAATAALAAGGRFSRLGMPGASLAPRLLGGDVGTWMRNRLQSSPPAAVNPLTTPPP